MSESRKSAIKKVMRMMNCSRSAATSYVDGQLRKIEEQLRNGIPPVRLGAPLRKTAAQPDPRFLVH